MRLVQLGRLAAEAEGVRLKLLAKRQAMRAVYGAVAAAFALFLVMMLHLVLFEYLAPAVGRRTAALILFALDLVATGIFAYLAAKSAPGAQEREAAFISRRARAELTTSMTSFAAVAPATRLAGARGWRGTLLTTVGTSLLDRFRRRR